MKIHELNIQANKDKKRVGRGIGSGKGKTAGRGTKGQNSRSGGRVRPGFEGGQNPLAKRLPKKRGFASLSRVTTQTIGLDHLETLKVGSVVTNETVTAAGWVKNPYISVKVLGNGTLTKKLTVKLQGATQSVQEAIEKAGGTFTAVPATRKPRVSYQKPSEQV